MKFLLLILKKLYIIYKGRDNYNMPRIGTKTREKLGLLPEEKPPLEGEDFTLYGIQKVEGKYRLVKLKFENGLAAEITKTEPDTAGVAIERFKLETAQLLMKVLNS